MLRGFKLNFWNRTFCVGGSIVCLTNIHGAAILCERRGETRACELTAWWERHTQAGNDSRIRSGCWGDPKERWLFQFRVEESSKAFWRKHNSSALFL